MINSKIGEISYNGQGTEMRIVEYKNTRNTTIEFQDEHRYRCVINYDRFKTGKVSNPYDKTMFGIGYMGEGKFRSRHDSKNCADYITWHGMFERCYNPQYLKKRPTYIGCSVCEEWHNFQNFAEWYHRNYYTIDKEVMCLDKDILIKGNKIYSPETCVFVPKTINSLFAKRQRDRGLLPIGVTFHKKNDKYVSVCCNCMGKTMYQYFDDPNEAFIEYKKNKENTIKKVADFYKNKIPYILYNTIYKYVVDITD